MGFLLFDGRSGVNSSVSAAAGWKLLLLQETVTGAKFL